MKRVLIAVALSTCALIATAQAPRPDALRIPGTGVTLVPPPGLTIAGAGPTLIDESGGEAFISFTQTEPRLALARNPMWRGGVFPSEPEHLEGELTGDLYVRTRENDGGGWDGWLLSITKGDKNLTVLATYTGISPETFRRFKEHLLTISWDPTIADPELAVGVSLTPKGLQVVRGGFGGGAYNRAGVFGAPDPSILVQALPIPAMKSADIFPAGCQESISAGVGSESIVGPLTKETQTYSYCEGWSKKSSPKMRYLALIRLPSGSLISVGGAAEAADFDAALPVFREAVATLRVLSRS